MGPQGRPPPRRARPGAARPRGRVRRGTGAMTDDGPRPMLFSALGPPAAFVDGDECKLGGGKRLVLLARLLLEPNRVVTVDRLAEDVWNGAPPPSAAATLQSHVSNLRRVLGADRVRTVGSGYTLEAGADEIEAAIFTSEV